MDLKEFVAVTLAQILEGVAAAQAKATGGQVIPNIWNAGRDNAAKLKILEASDGSWIHLVDFDVAVAVGESTETKGGIGLVVGPVVLGSKGQSNAENSSVSRIKFQVPIAYPAAKQA